MEIRDNKGSENVMVDHLSRFELDEQKGKACIQEMFPEEQLMRVEAMVSWDAIYVNYLACDMLLPEKKKLSSQQKKKFLHDVRSYLWDDPLLFNRGADQVIRRCVPDEKVPSILQQCYSSSYGGHFGAIRTAAKVLQCGFFWATVFWDAYAFVKSCDRCQRMGNISRQNELPLNNILEVEIFYV